VSDQVETIPEDRYRKSLRCASGRAVLAALVAQADGDGGALTPHRLAVAAGVSRHTARDQAYRARRLGWVRTVQVPGPPPTNGYEITEQGRQHVSEDA
jgi:hypothetical protein